MLSQSEMDAVNKARGAAQAKVDDEPTPGLRREPLDIPRFLNRQNNQ